MPLLNRTESQFQNRQREAELSDTPEKNRPPRETAVNGHGMENPRHAEIATLAYQLWQTRGCPEGSPDTDWFEAVRELRLRGIRHGNTLAV
jgi:hypothetical protein